MLLLQQAILSIAEPMLNRALSYDLSAEQKLIQLHNKSLCVFISELELTITLKVFDGRVFVSSLQEPADCSIKTSVNGLQKLSDAAQITSLIKNDELELEGDLQVAQRYSALFMSNDIDWQEWLSEYLGDAATHKLSVLLTQKHTYFKRKKRDLDYTVQSALVDELRVTPDKSELSLFSSSVDKLAAKTERLLRDVQQLKALL